MEKEEKGSQVTDVWQEHKLAQRLAGSRSACFSGRTPGAQWRRTLPWCKKRSTVLRNMERETKKQSLLFRLLTMWWLGHLVMGDLFQQSLPITKTVCQPRQPVKSHLSLVYSEPSISASELCHPPLCQLCHPVCCEAPPKLPFCYNETLSQSKSVPATPACHCQSNPWHDHAERPKYEETDYKKRQNDRWVFAILLVRYKKKVADWQSKLRI